MSQNLVLLECEFRKFLETLPCFSSYTIKLWLVNRLALMVPQCGVPSVYAPFGYQHLTIDYDFDTSHVYLPFDEYKCQYKYRWDSPFNPDPFAPLSLCGPLRMLTESTSPILSDNLKERIAERDEAVAQYLARCEAGLLDGMTRWWERTGENSTGYEFVDKERMLEQQLRIAVVNIAGQKDLIPKAFAHPDWSNLAPVVDVQSMFDWNITVREYPKEFDGKHLAKWLTELANDYKTYQLNRTSEQIEIERREIRETGKFCWSPLPLLQ